MSIFGISLCACSSGKRHLELNIKNVELNVSLVNLTTNAKLTREVNQLDTFKLESIPIHI